MRRLSLTDITKVYRSGEDETVALAHATLHVDAGELVAVVGPSGSGKTTLLAIAGALLHPTSGAVEIDGQPVFQLPPARLAELRLRRIGFILQSSNLVPFLTSRDQLLYVARLAGIKSRDAERQAQALLEELGLEHRANRYPESLSGGERQRVAIARALINDPAVILADEPTANLDSGRGRQVVEMIARLVKDGGKAGVMVTHDERMLDLCDRVYRIADGVLSEAGKPARI
jgi:putative ABC transport system ATP-binding protein